MSAGVVRMADADVERVVPALVRAFTRDPLFDWVEPRPEPRARFLAAGPLLDPAPPASALTVRRLVARLVHLAQPQHVLHLQVHRAEGQPRLADEQHAPVEQHQRAGDAQDRGDPRHTARKRASPMLTVVPTKNPSDT